MHLHRTAIGPSRTADKFHNFREIPNAPDTRHNLSDLTLNAGTGFHSFPLPLLSHCRPFQPTGMTPINAAILAKQQNENGVI